MESVLHKLLQNANFQVVLFLRPYDALLLIFFQINDLEGVILNNKNDKGRLFTLGEKSDHAFSTANECLRKEVLNLSQQLAQRVVLYSALERKYSEENCRSQSNMGELQKQVRELTERLSSAEDQLSCAALLSSRLETELKQRSIELRAKTKETEVALSKVAETSHELAIISHAFTRQQNTLSHLRGHTYDEVQEQRVEELDAECRRLRSEEQRLLCLVETMRASCETSQRDLPLAVASVDGGVPALDRDEGESVSFLGVASVSVSHCYQQCAQCSILESELVSLRGDNEVLSEQISEVRQELTCLMTQCELVRVSGCARLCCSDRETCLQLRELSHSDNLFALSADGQGKLVAQLHWQQLEESSARLLGVVEAQKLKVCAIVWDGVLAYYSAYFRSLRIEASFEDYRSLSRRYGCTAHSNCFDLCECAAKAQVPLQSGTLSLQVRAVGARPQRSFPRCRRAGGNDVCRYRCDCGAKSAVAGSASRSDMSSLEVQIIFHTAIPGLHISA